MKKEEKKTIESVIESSLQEMLDGGIIKKSIEEKFKVAVDKAVSEALTSYGGVSRKIEDGIKEVMFPVIERHDFSQYVLKLDLILSEFATEALGDNALMAENLKELLTEKAPGKITTSELFKKYCEFVAANHSTDDLEVDTDDEPCYYAEATMEVELDHNRDWDFYQDATIIFECPKDKSMNKKLYMYKRSNEKEWKIYRLPDDKIDIRSIKNISKFDLFVLSLNQAFSKVTIDLEDDCDDCIRLEQEPEWSCE